MVLVALVAIAAWISGQLFTGEPTQGEILKIFTKHETGGLITMIIIIIGSAFRIWLVVKRINTIDELFVIENEQKTYNIVADRERM
jgi:hypothetical protein